MLLGWVCIGCQSTVRAKTPEWSAKPIPPERCEECGANVFRRVEQATQAEGLYPDRKPESVVTDGNAYQFWENEGGNYQPAYGTGVDQDMDMIVEGVVSLPPGLDLDGLELGTFLASYYRHYTENNE